MALVRPPRSRRLLVVAAAVALVLVAVAAPGMGAAKAPVGVWSGPGFDWDYNKYTVLTIAKGPAGQQQVFFALENVGLCGDRPGVVSGPGSFEDGLLSFRGDFVCSDDNSSPEPHDVGVVLEYDSANDRWRGTAGPSGWWERRCVDPNDSATVDGVPNIIVGNKRDNKLRGTAGHDVIFGRGGNDTLIGKGGMDILCGAAGKDILKGKVGIDVMLGGGGNDKLIGGPDIDIGLGGPGKDKLKGGFGTDYLLGEAKNDVIKGQAGPNDLADGGRGGKDRCVAEIEVSCER